MRSIQRIVDFHVHVFPDGIAAAVVSRLSDEAGMPARSDGTAAGLFADMTEAGIALAVNLPVATRPEQVAAINRRLSPHASKDRPLISLGAMHPRCPGYDDELGWLAAQGFAGIKLHPEYQEFYPDDDKLAGFFESCARHKLIAVFHAGRDLAYAHVHGTPARFRQTAAVPGLTVLLAHMGGYRMWDEVERCLPGTGVFIETSFCHELEPARFAGLVHAFGAGRVLFGTDHPWAGLADSLEYIRQAGLSTDEQEMILSRNAASLLRLPEPQY